MEFHFGMFSDTDYCHVIYYFVAVHAVILINHTITTSLTIISNQTL
jgi:hypothetical protein